MNIMILTGDSNCKVVSELKQNHLINLCISYNFNDITSTLDIVFAHNYDQIIPEAIFDTPKYGIFILHSTDLPKGRGWAPIYNSIASKEQTYTITLLRASKKVDEGNIFLKLHIKKPINITNENLRDIDENGVLLVINKFIDLIINKTITETSVGRTQNNKDATYNKKRTPEDNNINENKTLKEAIYEILATNKDYPAYLNIDGEKIYLMAKVDKYYKLNDLDYDWNITV